MPAAATGFARSLLGKYAQGDVMYLALRADNNRLLWLVGHESERGPRYDLSPAEVMSLISAYYPGAKVEEYKSPEVQFPRYRRYMVFKREGMHYLDPALSADQIGSLDPLSIIAQTMNDAKSNEVLAYELLILEVLHLTEGEIRGELTTSPYELGHRYKPILSTNLWASLGSVTMAMVRNEMLKRKRVLAYSDADTKKYRNKLTEPLACVLVSLRFDTPDPERLEMFPAITSAIEGLSNPPETKIVSGFEANRIKLNDEEEAMDSTPAGAWAIAENAWSFLFSLSPAELAALWHLPHDRFSAPKINWLPGHQVAMSTDLASNRQGVCLGTGWFSGGARKVYMPDEDRATHTAIVGKNGVGKSTLLHHLIHQDIHAGRGVAVIDPHGTLVRDILQCSVPVNREGDVVILDLANEDYPPPLNPLAVPQGVEHAHAASQLMAVLHKYGSFEDTVTVAPTLWAALVTLWQEKTPTVRDVGRLFFNEAYRYDLMDRMDNPVAEEFWERFEEKKPGEQDKLATPVLNRLSTFYGNSTLYPIMCHPEALDSSSLIDQGKIILVSLKAEEKKLPPQEQYLLGAVLLSQLQIAVMDRSPDPAPFYLYIDEVQHFVTTALDTMFSEARKRGLALNRCQPVPEAVGRRNAGRAGGQRGRDDCFPMRP
ncbi:MAG: type IV secretion system DNA-binding domain-containing protein [Anaerolineae bacterium]|nr:type IV secretion system DNA-binding domain-containing protein [Anaerolineae bacterium]